MARYSNGQYSYNGRGTASPPEYQLISRIRSLEDLTEPVVNQLRVIGVTRPLPITSLVVSPVQFSMFRFRGLRLPPMTYDALVRRIILYPPLSMVQHSLIQIFNNWLYGVSKKMQTVTNKSYERMRDVQLGLSGLYRDSYYFTHLALRESRAKHPRIVLETAQGMPNTDGHHFGSNYVYEKAARWFEGSNGSVRLVIIVLITEDPLPSRSSPTTSNALSTFPTASNALFWGLNRSQILNLSISSLANHIISEDMKSESRIKVDIYCATQSYPRHRGHAEHVWHGTFEPSGYLCTDDTPCYASSFSLSSILSEKVKLEEEDKLFSMPLDELCVLLPRAIKEDRVQRAERLSRATQETIKKSGI